MNMINESTTPYSITLLSDKTIAWYQSYKNSYFCVSIHVCINAAMAFQKDLLCCLFTRSNCLNLFITTQHSIHVYYRRQRHLKLSHNVHRLQIQMWMRNIAQQSINILKRRSVASHSHVHAGSIQTVCKPVLVK